MTSLRIGLVTEGVTDHVVLSRLLQSQIGKIRPGLTLNFIDIQPYVDDTSRSSAGGWTQVFSWCLRNTPSARQSLYLGPPIFANSVETKRCDILVVSLDSDVCAEIGSKSPFSMPPSPPAPTERGDFIRQTILHWLWPDGLDNTERHVAIAAVESIETWLIAGLSSSVSPENIIDVMGHFIPLYYTTLGKKLPVGVKRIRKKRYEDYDRIAIVASENSDRIIEQCRFFKLAFNDIAAEIKNIHG